MASEQKDTSASLPASEQKDTSASLPASEQKDTFASLPTKISDNILSYLDGKSLLACCYVNKEWHRLVSSANDAWFRAAKDAGFARDSEARVIDWMMFFITNEKMSRADSSLCCSEMDSEQKDTSASLPASEQKDTSASLPASEQKDTFASLPSKISDNILSYLDGESLLACCCVNKEWNRLVSSANVLWFRACKEAGFATDSDASRVNDWRAFFVMSEKMSKAEIDDNAKEPEIDDNAKEQE